MGEKRREVAHDGAVDKRSVSSLLSQLEKEGVLKQRVITTMRSEGDGGEMKKITMVMRSDVSEDDPEVSVWVECEVGPETGESVFRVEGGEEGRDEEEVGGDDSERVRGSVDSEGGSLVWSV